MRPDRTAESTPEAADDQRQTMDHVAIIANIAKKREENDGAKILGYLSSKNEIIQYAATGAAMYYRKICEEKVIELGKTGGPLVRVMAKAVIADWSGFESVYFRDFLDEVDKINTSLGGVRGQRESEAPKGR